MLRGMLVYLVVAREGLFLTMITGSSMLRPHWTIPFVGTMHTLPSVAYGSVISFVPLHPTTLLCPAPCNLRW